MLTVFISGDRSAHPAYALPVIQQLLLKVLFGAAAPVTVVTGPHNGVEATVRFVCESVGIPLSVLPDPTRDWETYAQWAALQNPTLAYFVHGAPESSRIWAPLEAVLSDEVLSLVSPELLFTPA